jgi:hypothetical protein
VKSGGRKFALAMEIVEQFVEGFFVGVVVLPVAEAAI